MYMKLKDIELTLEGDEEVGTKVVAMEVAGLSDSSCRVSPERRPECYGYYPSIDCTRPSAWPFRRWKNLPEVLATAKSRANQVLRWKNPELPFVAAVKAPRSGLLVIDKAAINKQVLDTVKKMGDLAGYLPTLLTHDIRRGGAKDLAKLPKDVMKVYDTATSRAMGLNNVRTGRVYNEQEDEALNIHKARLPTTIIDQRLPQAESAYIPPPRRVFKKMVREYIVKNVDDLLKGSSMPLAFFVGPKPKEHEPTSLEHEGMIYKVS
ncbi:hypothetical protein LTS15_009255 [Exophiala xenobiotica]|nr:hypothetical protein LTS15_009255 [Exophiala xenobiotica]